MYVGLDIGGKNTGVAVSLGSMALPSDTVDTKDILKKIQQLEKEEEIEGVVAGLPVNMSGEETDQTREIRDVVLDLEKKLNIKIELVDERLSSIEAINQIKNSGVSEKEAKKHKDHGAASIILQTYLDSRDAI